MSYTRISKDFAQYLLKNYKEALSALQSTIVKIVDIESLPKPSQYLPVDSDLQIPLNILWVLEEQARGNNFPMMSLAYSKRDSSMAVSTSHTHILLKILLGNSDSSEITKDRFLYLCETVVQDSLTKKKLKELHELVTKGPYIYFSLSATASLDFPCPSLAVHFPCEDWLFNYIKESQGIEYFDEEDKDFPNLACPYYNRAIDTKTLNFPVVINSEEKTIDLKFPHKKMALAFKQMVSNAPTDSFIYNAENDSISLNLPFLFIPSYQFYLPVSNEIALFPAYLHTKQKIEVLASINEATQKIEEETALCTMLNKEVVGEILNTMNCLDQDLDFSATTGNSQYTFKDNKESLFELVCQDLNVLLDTFTSKNNSLFNKDFSSFWTISTKEYCRNDIKIYKMNKDQAELLRLLPSYIINNIQDNLENIYSSWKNLKAKDSGLERFANDERSILEIMQQQSSIWAEPIIVKIDRIITKNIALLEGNVEESPRCTMQ